MALLHQAELRPTKLELISGWAPSQPWFDGEAGVALTSAGAYRFDDPDGEVGVETLLVHAGNGATLQLPLTYRGVPLEDADEWLIGTLQHSVLGTRWVYDGAGDPVYLLTAATTIVTGGSQADLYIDVDGERVKREPTARVTGSGVDGVSTPVPPAVHELEVNSTERETVVEASAFRLTIPRVLDGGQQGAGPADGVLAGTWAEQTEPQPLVFLALR